VRFPPKEQFLVVYHSWSGEREVLYCVGVCCSVLKSVAVCCHVLPCDAVCNVNGPCHICVNESWATCSHLSSYWHLVSSGQWRYNKYKVVGLFRNHQENTRLLECSEIINKMAKKRPFKGESTRDRNHFWSPPSANSRGPRC